MEYRPFGQTGLDVSAIGFGCWEIGGGYGDIERPGLRPRRRPGARPRHQLLRHRRGLRHGRVGARRSGEALGSRRDEAIIVTKFGMNYRDKPNLRDSSRERVTASIDKSLKNLGTDYVDVYMVHWPDRDTPFEETMRALDDSSATARSASSGSPTSSSRRSRPAWQVGRVDVVQYGWQHVRPAHAAGDPAVLRGARHRVHGLRLARLRAADRHVHRRPRLRQADWRCASGEAWAAIKMFDAAVRRGEVPPTTSRAVERAEGASPPATTGACRSSRCAGPSRTRR